MIAPGQLYVRATPAVTVGYLVLPVKRFVQPDAGGLGVFQHECLRLVVGRPALSSRFPSLVPASGHLPRRIALTERYLLEICKLASDVPPARSGDGT